MKLFVCVTVAQEIDGKSLLVRFDKCSTDVKKVEEFIKSNKSSWIEKIPVDGTNKDFACERHPHEVEVEDT